MDTFKCKCGNVSYKSNPTLDYCPACAKVNVHWFIVLLSIASGMIGGILFQYFAHIQ